MILEGFKTAPYAHQRECLELSQDRRAYAILLEQGLGKTKIALDTAAHLYRRGEIDALLVVAPNGVHGNWVRREIPTHLSDDVDSMALEWRGRWTKGWEESWRKLLVHSGLSVLAINVEALSSSGRAEKMVETFLKHRRAMFVVDESSRIKTPSSKRTRRVVRLGKMAPYRRVMTGTPVTQSPFDLYSQFQFLDPKLLGFSSYYAFRNNYGVFERRRTGSPDGARTWQYEHLVKYVRLNDLRERIAPHSYRRTKDECLDLPEKIYQRVSVDLSPVQQRLYDQMMDEGVIEIPDEGIELLAPLQIVRLMRCQQITGGFLPTGGMDEEPQVIPGKNSKIAVLLELLEEDYPGKAIVWARFRAEIRLITEALRERFGQETVVELHGGVPGETRSRGIDGFQTDPAVRFVVGQQQSGVGITLNAAETVFYYSNSFSYEQRYQSEDRAHRIGLRHPVVYVDLEARGTVDERIRDVLKGARKLAGLVTGDKR